MNPHREGYLDGRQCEGLPKFSNDWRVPELRQLAKLLGLRASGRKAELCARLREYYLTQAQGWTEATAQGWTEATAQDWTEATAQGWTEATAQDPNGEDVKEDDIPQTQSVGPEDNVGFYSPNNPKGYTRKVEFREINPSVPFLIISLERVMDLDGEEMVVDSEIRPDGIIKWDEENALFLRASIVYRKGHYFTYFQCDGVWWLYDDLKEKIERVGSYQQLLQDTDILKYGVMHFYTHYKNLCDDDIDCGKIGPKWFENSCYMDSVLFALFSLGNDELSQRLLETPLIDTLDNTPSGDVVCSKKVKMRIREELRNLQDYFQGRTVTRPICRNLRNLFSSCKLGSYEDFSTGMPRSPSEFLTYLFAIFNVEDESESLLTRFTWGTYDLDANSEILFTEAESTLPFVLSSDQTIEFNYIVPIDAFKIQENAGATVSELLMTLEDNTLK